MTTTGTKGRIIGGCRQIRWLIVGSGAFCVVIVAVVMVVVFMRQKNRNTEWQK